ncbi:glycosyltransferase [Nitrosococcus wardiae]|uniref:Glycosyltransferase n=1 Tax=Nitrosococcus wardiae TaxID=1814290 RepID=A0A4P7BYP4_9GAMM|nr:glycosyltransferase [Nitrosococcus wardiae]QBQ53546.1 glycosyltransferase [Nitrosococcus wardiae]
MANSDKTERLLIFVLGMHRSGTSLLAKAVEVSGADLGDKLMPPAFDNPKGFWEDRDAFEINTALLETLDLRWDIPSTVPFIDFTKSDLAPLRARVAALLAEKMSESRVVAIKDPRLSLLLPFWLAAAKQEDIQTRFVVSVRNPIDVANSLNVRNGFEQQKGLILWINHYYLILRYLQELPVEPPLFIDYLGLLREPQRELTRLIRFIEENKSFSHKKINWFTEQFVDKELCHSASTMEDVRQENENIPGLLEIYECLNEFAASGWSRERAKSLLDKIDPLALEARSYRCQLRYFKKELDEGLAKKAQELEEQKQAELQWFKQQLERKDQELSRLALRMVKETTALVRQKDEEINTLRAAKDEEINTLRVVKDEEINALRAAKDEEINTLRVAKDEEINAIRTTKDRELKELIGVQKEIDAHFQGAMGRIEDIKTSLSYRLGMGITWPARKVYDRLCDPFAKHPSNLHLMLQITLLAIRYPYKSLKLLNRERIQNAYITFVKKPTTAKSVVNYYTRMLHGSPLVSYERAIQAFEDPDSFLINDLENKRKVSIIIVNYNGRHHLQDLLISLQEQSYQDFEIILVDNGSSDGSIGYVRDHFPTVKIVALAENTGFAEGNNIGAEVSNGRYFCLVNNDMEADRDWLKGLVACIEQSPEIGAVGPKILFWKKFARIELKASANVDVWMDVSALEESAPVYKKWFFSQGWEQEQSLDGKQCLRFKQKAKFQFPICEGQTSVKLRLKAEADSEIPIKISSTALHTSATCFVRGEHWSEVTLDFKDQTKSPALRYLINNAASEADDWGEVRDRGFGEPDEGQFDCTEAVTALCGGAMLIRREALKGKPIFAGHFFAYFEDTELSLRISEGGYRLAYCPESIIYHKHASSSKENSAFFRYYVNRNRILFLASHYSEDFWKNRLQETEVELNHLHSYYQKPSCTPEEQEFARKIPEIFTDWERLLPMIERGSFIERKSRFPKIAVYNNFWNTLGGGEHHACVIAQTLQKLGPVDLISENDFSITTLERQFGIELKFCRKRMVSPEYIHYHPEATSPYDIFVNSAFGSDLKCASRLSYYIVSFPYRLDDRPDEAKDFLATYNGFLANSNYTAYWVKRWWGVDSQLLYPSIAIPNIDLALIQKEKRILNVGRFFKDGHSKKQLEMVRVFKWMKNENILDDEWRLTFVGQVHHDQIEYLDAVRQEAEGYPVDFHVDLPLDDLKYFYMKSAIYWHATGLNEDINKRPDLYEHFGITTVEAMSYGCVPIVINAAGQKETVEHGRNGFLFNNEKELIEYTQYCTNLFLTNRVQYDHLSHSALQRSYQFSREAAGEQFLKILKGDGYKVAVDFMLY